MTKNILVIDMLSQNILYHLCFVKNLIYIEIPTRLQALQRDIILFGYITKFNHFHAQAFSKSFTKFIKFQLCRIWTMIIISSVVSTTQFIASLFLYFKSIQN